MGRFACLHFDFFPPFPRLAVTHPHAPTQERLYRSGILAAHLEPNDFGYIECHGTGTQAGDFEECSGLINTFAKTRPADLPLVVGSAKANLGHSESVGRSTHELARAGHETKDICV